MAVALFLRKRYGSIRPNRTRRSGHTSSRYIGLQGVVVTEQHVAMMRAAADRRAFSCR